MVRWVFLFRVYLVCPLGATLLKSGPSGLFLAPGPLGVAPWPIGDIFGPFCSKVALWENIVSLTDQ